MSENERQLLLLLKERCYREGNFTLSSGEKSSYYFDAKNAFLSSTALSLIGEILFEGEILVVGFSGIDAPTGVRCQVDGRVLSEGA